MKRVCLIRHGHSEHNYSTTKRVSWLGGLFLRDSPLTAVGRSQASRLGDELRSDEQHPLRQVEVVISSPLSRAIETSLLIFGEEARPPRCISHLHTERCIFPCDTGRTTEELLTKFSCLEQWEGFSQLPAEWWPKDRSIWQEVTPRDRVDAFRRYLAQRSEAVLAVVGHAGFFGELVGKHMSNCALHQAAAEHARRQLAQARREGKDREALEQEIHELRLELTQAKNTMQIRLREQEAEFQKQCLELRATRLEEEKRQRREDARRSPALTERATGGAEISRIEGSLEDVSMLSEGAAEAINKMKLLEDQLRSWQGLEKSDKSLITGDPGAPAAGGGTAVVSERPEAELLLEMQQEHLLTIHLKRQALEARRCAEFRMVRSASLPNSILDSIPSRLATSPEASKQAMVPRSEPCLLQKLEASPNSAGAVLGSSRSNGANISASGSPPRDFAQPKEEAKEPSPCSCQALSPAPSLEAATADRPDLFVGAGPADSPMDVDTRCQGSPSRAAAGRLPPLAGVEKPPERGTIGLVGDLSPSRRPEIDTQQQTQEPQEAERPQTEVTQISGTLDARLKEVELDRASWRRRTLLLEEQMQRLLQQQSAKSEVRWRPQALQLEEENTEAEAQQDAWKEQRQLLEAQLAQAVAERDRMIEATNELRADVRRLTSRRKGSREALEEGGPHLPRERRESDRFGVMGSAASSSPEKPGYSAEPPKAPEAPRFTLSLPIPAAGTPGVAHVRRPEVEVPGSASLSRSPSPPGWPPPSPETVHSEPHGLPMPPPMRPQPAWSPWSPANPPPVSATIASPSHPEDASPAAMRVRDALKMLSPRRCKSTSPNRR